MNTQTINIRINKNTKQQAQKIVEKMGLDLSSAVKLFLNKVILTKSIPFSIRTVNGYTPEFEAKILKEVKHTAKYGKRYSSTEEAFKNILG
jgi:addiction module RelB/DinJ family antitoxin